MASHIVASRPGGAVSRRTTPYCAADRMESRKTQVPMRLLRLPALPFSFSSSLNRNFHFYKDASTAHRYNEERGGTLYVFSHSFYSLAFLLLEMLHSAIRVDKRSWKDARAGQWSLIDASSKPPFILKAIKLTETFSRTCPHSKRKLGKKIVDIYGPRSVHTEESKSDVSL